MEGQQFRTRHRIPEAHSSIIAARDNAPAIRTEYHRVNRATVSGKSRRNGASRSIPDFDGSIRAGGDDAFTIWAKSYRESLAGMPGQSPLEGAC